MKCNIGNTDRITRLVAGFGIMIVGVITDNWLGLIGLVPVLTAAFRFCPLYVPLKMSTVKEKN